DNDSTIIGNRRVKSLPGRLYSLTRSPSLRAMIRNPSCLISCSHRPPDGSVWALVGRHGAMNPAAKVRGRNDMADRWRPGAKESSAIAPPGMRPPGLGKARTAEAQG